MADDSNFSDKRQMEIVSQCPIPKFAGRQIRLKFTCLLAGRDPNEKMLKVKRQT